MTRQRLPTSDAVGQRDPTREADSEVRLLDVVWEAYKPTGGILRISYTSCCGALELASEGGHFFVLRSAGDGGYEETGRGLYRQAIDLYIALAERHRDEHLHRREKPAPDAFLKGKERRG